MTSVEKLTDLVEQAAQVSSFDFLQLVKRDTLLLANERGRVGTLYVAGRLIRMPPNGEAILIGDVHGDLDSLLHVLWDSNLLDRMIRGENVFLIFLGDYGDRGIYSPEVYYVILQLKELFPENTILMRGNHEGPRDILAHPHDLPAHLRRKFGNDWINIYANLCQLFTHLYTAVLVEKRFLMLHGGVPSKASTVEDLAYAHKLHPQESHLEEILWSDPSEKLTGTCYSPRGAGRLFGEDITNKILNMLHVNLLIRGHEPSTEGYKINHKGKVLTIFSRRGPPYHNNQGAYLPLNLSEIKSEAQQLKRQIKQF